VTSTSHGDPGLNAQLPSVLVDAEYFDEREGDADLDGVGVVLDRSHVPRVAAQQLVVQPLLVLRRFCAAVATLHATHGTYTWLRAHYTRILYSRTRCQSHFLARLLVTVTPVGYTIVAGST